MNNIGINHVNFGAKIRMKDVKAIQKMSPADRSMLGANLGLKSSLLGIESSGVGFNTVATATSAQASGLTSAQSITNPIFPNLAQKAVEVPAEASAAASYIGVVGTFAKTTGALVRRGLIDDIKMPN